MQGLLITGCVVAYVTLSLAVTWTPNATVGSLGLAGLFLQSTMDESQVIEQIRGFHDGTMTTIAFDEVEGLVSFPSFHVAGAMFVTWAFRDYRWLFYPLALLNITLAASTFMSGLHYAVDAPGGVAVFRLSLAAYKWWGEPLYRKTAAASDAGVTARARS
jgi:membrane-associated phospholipid phosphatase